MCDTIRYGKAEKWLAYSGSGQAAHGVKRKLHPPGTGNAWEAILSALMRAFFSSPDRVKLDSRLIAQSGAVVVA